MLELFNHSEISFLNVLPAFPVGTRKYLVDSGSECFRGNVVVWRIGHFVDFSILW